MKTKTPAWPQRLIRWFKRSARNLPWRQNRSPYRVWLSEIMLQQTQVETVIPYYQRFLKRWPTLRDLAQAPTDAVLKEWEGLGYYSRARNLHLAAKKIVADHANDFPPTYEDILKLPGVGPYTAGAIASLAFNQKHAAVDGNVCRVISRLQAKKMDPTDPKARKSLGRFLEAIMPSKNPGPFNEALMELGARLCKPKNPECRLCPLKKDCQAFLKGKVEDYPGIKSIKIVRQERVGLVILRRGNQVLMRQNPPQGLLGGLWGFPFYLIKTTETAGVIEKNLPYRIEIKRRHPSFVHKFTHIHMTHHPIEALVKSKKKPNGVLVDSENSRLTWKKIGDLKDLGLPRAHRRLYDQILIS